MLHMCAHFPCLLVERCQPALYCVLLIDQRVDKGILVGEVKAGADLLQALG